MLSVSSMTRRRRGRSREHESRTNPRWSHDRRMCSGRTAFAYNSSNRFWRANEDRFARRIVGSGWRWTGQDAPHQPEPVITSARSDIGVGDGPCSGYSVIGRVKVATCKSSVQRSINTSCKGVRMIRMRGRHEPMSVKAVEPVWMLSLLSCRSGR